MIKYFSMFSGIGGFELGILNGSQTKRFQQRRDIEDLSNIEQSQFSSKPLCVGYSEIDKYAIQVYEKHFKGHRNYGDATKIKWSDVPDFGLMVGGFPCQAFSIAGKRKGFSDIRGTMFFEIARALREKQPRLCVLENVKGLLSHDKGHTFFTILTTLDELGYDCQWQVLNSNDFGVPQNRERVFIIGYLREEPRPEVFPITGTNRETIKQLNHPDRVYDIDGISPTLNTMQDGNRQPFIKAVLTPDRLEKRQNGRRFKENEEPSFTLTAQDKHGVYDGVRIRRLTPLECERLQGFPIGWTYGLSDTQRYKCLGNAVTVNVVEYIMNKLLMD